MRPADIRGSMRGEFKGVKLKDRRLDARLGMVVAAVSRAPDKAFPQVMASEAELEAFYRFVGNERIDWQQILEPHCAATARRCRAAKQIVVPHDTSEFDFGGSSRADQIGHLQHGHSGFYGHFALGVSLDETRAPLGILGVQTRHREKAKRLSAAQIQAKSRSTEWTDKESHRWVELVETVEERIGEVSPIHVMDREADDYVLLATLCERQRRFVVRISVNRQLQSSLQTPARVRDALEETSDVFFREVPLGQRVNKEGSARRLHPTRATRRATLHIRARHMVVLKPSHAQTPVPSLSLNVVEVFEPHPPDGESPVSWMLVTTEPIETLEERTRIVDAYRCRWRIEEFFKSLKTGCSFEKRQLESERALLNTMALLVPMAWRLLLLRNLARESPDAPAAGIMTPDELELLRLLSKRVKLSSTPTIQEVMLAIAGLGGHLKRNGPPGWLTLGRGYEEFRVSYSGWMLARSQKM